MSITLVCDSCEKEVTISESNFKEKDSWKCKECGGNMEEQEEDSDDSCFNCKKKSDDLESCAECGEDICEGCMVHFESASNICNKCIDKFYPRKIEYQDKIVEKIVEKPIIKYLDKEGKEVERTFNENSKTRFD